MASTSGSSNSASAGAGDNNADSVKSKCPTTIWGQRKNDITITLQLSDCKVLKKIIDENAIDFEGNVGKDNYKLQFELFANIDVGKSKCHVTAQYIQFKLRIKHIGAKWSRLTKSTEKLPYLKLDFNNLDTDSSSDETENSMDSDEDEDAVVKPMQVPIPEKDVIAEQLLNNMKLDDLQKEYLEAYNPDLVEDLLSESDSENDELVDGEHGPRVPGARKA